MKNWKITAQNAGELAVNFGSLGIRVPARTDKKDQFAEEMYCLRRYLFPVANNGLVAFPIELVKQETPDFVFTSSGAEPVGLEVTKATREQFEADLTRLDRGQKTRDYVSDLATRAMHLDEPGWVGGAAETEWIIYVLGSVSQKLSVIATYSVAECDLLIYDNTPLPSPDLNSVAEGIKLHFASAPLADKRTFVPQDFRDTRPLVDLRYCPQSAGPAVRSGVGSAGSLTLMKVEYIAKYFDDRVGTLPVRFELIVAETDSEAAQIAADHMSSAEMRVDVGRWQGFTQIRR
jgi:hypothetical protein